MQLAKRHAPLLTGALITFLALALLVSFSNGRALSDSTPAGYTFGTAKTTASDLGWNATFSNGSLGVYFILGSSWQGQVAAIETFVDVDANTAITRPPANTVSPTAGGAFPVNQLIPFTVTGLQAIPANVGLHLVNAQGANIGFSLATMTNNVAGVNQSLVTPTPTSTPVPEPTATPVPTTVVATVTPVPTPTGGTVAVIQPNAPSTVSSPDNTVQIKVPALATSTTAQIEYKPADVAQAPAPPAGTTLIKAFELNLYDANGNVQTSVTFINPITITVKYTDADVAAAGGDPGRLKIARYSSATGAWTILTTTVDVVNKTLTATVGGLSVFSIAAAPPAQGAAPTPTPTPTATPTPTPTPTATPTPTPTPTATPTPAPTPTPPKVGDVTPGNGMLVGLAVLGVMLLAIGAFYLTQSRKRSRI